MVTGSRVPDQLTIQIMTLSGKVVKEITKEDLGPLHIGMNRTSYKWDGRDEYGAKLANGVYLYRVLSHIDGEEIETFEIEADSFFNEGFGKMVIMR
jgi:flagellar hook assembly protein FlgD